MLAYDVRFLDENIGLILASLLLSYYETNDAQRNMEHHVVRVHVGWSTNQVRRATRRGAA